MPNTVVAPYVCAAHIAHQLALCQDSKVLSRPSFHHGNLREALLEAALAEIERSGIEGLSLRELSEQIGVSRSAPYRHFKDKNALIAAVAEIVQGELFDAYAGIPAQLPAVARLRCASKAYLDFTQKRPKLFRLLFLDNHYWCSKGAQRPRPAHSALSVYSTMIHDSMTGANASDVAAAIVACWSALHGFAILRTDNRLGDLGPAEVAEEALLDRVLKMVS